MKTKYFASILSLALSFAMSSAFAQTAVPAAYSFKTLDYSGDTFTQLLGINDSNDIAGYHGFAVNQGFTYSTKNAAFTTENYPGSAMTQVVGINDEPFKTVGFFVAKGTGKTEGFTDYLGSFKTVDYPKTPFNQLLGQNNVGQAAGYYSTKADGSGPDHPYVYDEFGGVFELFTIPGSTSAQATGINDMGDVCGFTIDSVGNSHGWMVVQGTYTQLDDPDGVGATAAFGINNKGLVVGTYSDTSGGTHGFVYTVSSKTWQTIDDPSGIGNTIVNGVNNKGLLVGFYGPQACGTNDCHGFIATP